MSFVREPAGEAHRLELMIGPATGGAPSTWRRLVADHPWADKPRWSADGRLMYFLSRGSGDYFDLWALPFDPIRGEPAGTAFPLTRFDSPALFLSPYVGRMNIEIKNRTAVLTMSSSTGSIWMLEGIGVERPHASSR
jgi:hypothetical protein